MKRITQTDAQELALLREILNAANSKKVEMHEAAIDCLNVIHWKFQKRHLVRIRQKYDAVRGEPSR